LYTTERKGECEGVTGTDKEGGSLLAGHCEEMEGAPRGGRRRGEGAERKGNGADGTDKGGGRWHGRSGHGRGEGVRVRARVVGRPSHTTERREQEKKIGWR